MSRNSRESKNRISPGKKNLTWLYGLISPLFFLLLGILAIWSYYSVRSSGILDGYNSIMSLSMWFAYAFSTPLCKPSIELARYIISSWQILLIFVCIGLLIWLYFYNSRGNFDKVQHGSAHWATEKEKRVFRRVGRNMPLAERVYLTEEAKPANRNVFVLAAPGGGKTFNVIIPGIEAVSREGEGQGSFICTDTKGALYRDTVKMVKDRGLKVYLLNLSDPFYSHRYNPLDNVHSERAENEISKLALAYVKNVRDEEAGTGDAVWEDTFKELLCCVWKYQYQYEINPLTNLPETRAMWRTAELIKGLRLNGKGQIDEGCELALIVNEIRKADPLSAIISSYDFVTSGAGETVASVIFTAGSKIGIFTYSEIECMTRKNDIPIDDIVQTPSAVYINYEIGSAYKAIAALFIEQLFASAYYIAETKYNGTLPNPLKMFLDELPNICRVYSLPERASTSRSYNIDLIIAVQSMQQLKRMFKDAEHTLMNNCVTHIYLGTGETDALKQISEALGKTTTSEVSFTHNTGSSKHSGGNNSERQMGRELAFPSEIYSMPDKYAIVKMQHHQPIFAEKFKTYDRDYYKLLGGKGNPQNNRTIQSDLKTVRLINEAEYMTERAERIARMNATTQS